MGTGLGNSVMEIVNTVERLTGKGFEKSVGERRSGDAIRAVADNRKAMELLGWAPHRSIEQSVKTLMQWYGERPHGWTK